MLIYIKIYERMAFSMTKILLIIFCWGIIIYIGIIVRKEAFMNRRIFSAFSNLLLLFGGSALFGVAMNMFLSPAKVVMGGITGIATTINFVFPKVPIGLAIMVLNIPLLILNVKMIGARSMLKTVAGIAFSSIMIDALVFLPVGLEEPLLCALFGGALIGSGTGMMLIGGYTTGGTDLSASLIRRKFKGLSTGKMVLLMDAAVIIGSAIVMKDFQSVIYSAVSIFACSVSIDAVMGGADRAKLAMIISSEYERIARAVSSEVNRGVTLLHGSGYYSGENKEILMCVVKRHEEYQLKKVVEKIDPDAFMILSDATEVLGMGFKKIDDNAEDQKTAEKKLKKKRK